MMTVLTPRSCLLLFLFVAQTEFDDPVQPLDAADAMNHAAGVGTTEDNQILIE
jgi:hypothetical protein